MYLKRNKATKKEVADTLNYLKESYEFITKNLQEDKPRAN